MYNPFYPPPAPPGFGEGQVVPEEEVSVFSKVVFEWLGPFLTVGFSRPLQKEDFWQLPREKLTQTLSEKIENDFYSRCPPEKRPTFLHDIAQARSSALSPVGPTVTTDKSEIHVTAPSSQLEKTASASGVTDGTSEPNANGQEQQPFNPSASLTKTIYHTFYWNWWISGFLKLFSDTLNTTTPLVNKVLLTWLTNAYIYYNASEEERAVAGLIQPRGIGYGVGLGFAIFVMQEASSLMANHYQQRLVTMTIGMSTRTGTIGAIFRKSLRLSGRARLEHSIGEITTMISTDATRLDRNSAFFHNLWVAPIQIAIGIGLLINNLGYSALVGLGVLIIGFPIQFVLVRAMFMQRAKGVKLTDQRVRLTTEILQGIRLLKFYAWEGFYAHHVGDLREREVNTIRSLSAARSGLIGIVTVVPVLASVLSFITYGLSGHDLDVATIFSSLQFFNIIRAPLIFLPLVLASLTDAMVAIRRISKFLIAEELAVPYVVDKSTEFAVDVDGDFTWETVEKAVERGDKKKRSATQKKHTQVSKVKHCILNLKAKGGTVLPTTDPTRTTKEKDSVDEDTLKEDDDEPFELKNLKLQIPKGSFVAIVGKVGSGKSSLLQALIGEMRKTRGKSVFGATVAYAPQTSWIMNATLRQNVMFGQAEDERKFREVVKACCLEPDLAMLPHGEDTEIGEKGINLSGGQKARVSLARAAYSGADIVIMDDSLSAVDAYVGKTILDSCLLSGPLAGKTRILVTHALHVLDKTDYIYVMDEGVIVEQGAFNDLMANSVHFSHLMEEYGNLEQQDTEIKDSEDTEKFAEPLERDEAKSQEGALMQAEERLTGSVSYSVYAKYLRFAGGLAWAPTIILLLVLYQGAQVSNNLFLGFWTASSIHGFTQGDYMGVYAALGISSGIFAFLLSLSIWGLSMFKVALMAVLRSPVSFFDTTPMGRILQLLSTFSSVLGTVALVFYTFPYLGIIFVPLMILYYLAAIYYRRSSVETKRLDSLLRSALYASYSESLTGLSTVRAYGEQDRFINKSDYGLDLENRAYYMTIAIQRWLGVRLDILGNILILGIVLFAAGFRDTVNPSKIGVVLSYTLSITQTFSAPEGAITTSNDPPPSWPDKGEITFKDVQLAYREGLPLVLNGVSFTVRPGEKVGIVGRTGAGKSSLLQALFRIVNVQAGSITIDGLNIRDIGLDILRGRLALVPQDNILFKGTLRENLDPQGTRTDAELLSALRRAWLLPAAGHQDTMAEAKFSLDSAISDEAREKALLALCRALVKNSRVIVLDEATSNVDVETDAKVQRTIQTEFSSSTLLCIAHRLNTIVYYDRIIVMDGRQAAPAFGEEDVVPEKQASLLSKLTFAWLDPFLSVGFSRPLQKEDFWQLPNERLTSPSATT
ncbi:Canalicular multispecific organic anion transporter 1 [Grifola frondosa]|uniref:Canalicular multispecific organic anion transporter 1 n=1 Tax=Grifola frondosa TaxID=5627 RepID=A0A1C7MPX3_GRIFR|nr:Canalicular multispecific organic anion transporter 1 [Grifola frondosa]